MTYLSDIVYVKYVNYEYCEIPFFSYKSYVLCLFNVCTDVYCQAEFAFESELSMFTFVFYTKSIITLVE